MGPSLFFPGLPLNENTRRTIAQKIRALFAGSVEGAWYDPSDLSTMFQAASGKDPVTATGQTVGLILDKRLGLVRGAPITHESLSTAGTVVDNGNGTWTITAGSIRFLYPLAQLVSGYSYNIQFTASGVTGSPGVDLADVFSASFGDGAVSIISSRSVYDATYRFVDVVAGATATVTAPVLTHIAGNHAYQTTSGSRPVFRDVAGVRYLEFDGVDDYLRATFTIAQPIDRISAIQQASWTNADYVYDGVTANTGILYQLAGSPSLRIYSGTPVVMTPDLAVATSGVVTERHDGASSRVALNNNAYVTGDAGANLPGGLTIGASFSPAYNGNIFLHQLIMRGGTTALTDTQITLLRKVCYAAAGLPFPGYEETEVSRMFSSAPTATGAWYDPSDLSTMFQDRYGTTPVTATGQPVGLMLDKRLGYALGAQFSIPGIWIPGGSGISGSGSTVTLAGASAGAFVGRSLGLTPGLRYRIDYTVSNYSSGGVAVNPGGNFNSPMARANGAYAAHMVCDPDSNFYVVADADGGTLTVTIDAVRQIPGNHAYQATSAARPIFRDVGGLRYLEFDGVDDKLQSLFTIAQPIDRISALQQVSWTNGDRLLSGGTANAAEIFQNSASPEFGVHYGASFHAAAASPALGVNGVITERLNGVSSRVALNSATYVTGNGGTGAPGGVTLGALYGAGTGNSGNCYIYQTIMRGGTTAMTDAQIAACRALSAVKSGVTL